MHFIFKAEQGETKARVVVLLCFFVNMKKNFKPFFFLASYIQILNCKSDKASMVTRNTLGFGNSVVVFSNVLYFFYTFPLCVLHRGCSAYLHSWGEAVRHNHYVLPLKLASLAFFFKFYWNNCELLCSYSFSYSYIFALFTF